MRDRSTQTTNADEFTQVTVFTVDPRDQDALVTTLVEGARQAMQTLPGLISTNIQRSSDGTQVVNEARWLSRRHFEAVQHDLAGIPQLAEAQAIAARSEPYIYDMGEVETRVTWH